MSPRVASFRDIVLPAALLSALALAAPRCAPSRRVGPPLAAMEEKVPRSLRGADELGAVPARPDRPPHARRGGFSWDGPRGRRILRGWTKRSRSIGRPSSGSLDDGYELPEEGPGFFHRGDSSWGTDELVAVLLWGLHRVQQHYPDTVRICVGDLSPAGGGRCEPHRSHQSGRDVDVGYYAVGNRPVRRFVTVDARTLDAEKTWALFEALLSTGMVQYLFVDYGLQQPLYEQALAAGWSEDDLGEVFQYPRGRRTPRGIVRHVRGHDDHFHLRILCPVEDEDCVP